MNPNSPDLSSLSFLSLYTTATKAGTQVEADLPSPPPAPTDTSGDEYFYLMHRPHDWDVPTPDKVREIIDSGGVVPGNKRHFYLHTQFFEDVPQMAPPYSGEGVPENGASAFLHESLNNKDNFQLGKARKGYVAWYYLNTRRQHNVLELASEEELVFRVPIAWLQYNALWCVENPPRAADDPPTAFLPQALLTALRVPLAYRITSPVRLKDEDTRLMSNNDVFELVYSAYVEANPNSRKRYDPPTPPPRPKGQPPPRINPFES